jgi:glutaredoxin 3
MTAQIKMYTRKWCGYCSAAERLLENKGVEFEEIDVTGNNDMRKWLAKVTGQRTVPQIFIDGTSIGGFTELRALERDGELDKLLWDKPASNDVTPPRSPRE